MREPVVLCWSGGKDSVLALDRLRAGSRYEVHALLTTITAQRRVQMHGVIADLIEAQACALGIPVVFCEMPAFPSNTIYEQSFAVAVRRTGVRTVAFGDLFLSDIRQFREALCDRLQLTPIFPVWGIDTAELAHDFQTGGYRAVTCCVDGRVLPSSWAGREYNASFLRDLPPGVDSCGENGEFHTFVYDGPAFSEPVLLEQCEIVEQNSFWYCEFKRNASPAADPNMPRCSIRQRDKCHA